MEAVLDANVLFRILISQGTILEIVFNDDLKLYAPQRLKEEFEKHEKEILEKSGLPQEIFSELKSLLFERITFVALNDYKLFLPKAKQLLGQNEKDVEFVALCLLKNIKVWTYDASLWSIGFGISTKQIAKELSKH